MEWKENEKGLCKRSHLAFHPFSMYQGVVSNERKATQAKFSAPHCTRNVVGASLINCQSFLVIKGPGMTAGAFQLNFYDFISSLLSGAITVNVTHHDDAKVKLVEHP